MEKVQSLHSYIKDELLERIKSEVYKPGDKIPTEYELCETFDVSRTTVRTALNQLTLEGYLVRQQGKGTFVADHKVKQTLSQTVKRYNDQVAVQGKEGAIELLEMFVIPANETLQKKLNVQANAPIQQIIRVRKVDGIPTQYEMAYIPWDVAPGVTKQQAETSLYASLTDDFNVSISKTTENIELALADERIALYLQCEMNLPCFYMETIAEGANGEILEYSRAYFRGDKTNFMIERNY